MVGVRFDTSFVRAQAQALFQDVTFDDAPSVFAVAAIHGFSDAARKALVRYHARREDLLLAWACDTCGKRSDGPAKCHRAPMERCLNRVRGLEAIPERYLCRMPTGAVIKFSTLLSKYINMTLEDHEGMWAKLAEQW